MIGIWLVKNLHTTTEYWKLISQKNQAKIRFDKNNKNENMISHTYQVGDRKIIKNNQ